MKFKIKMNMEFETYTCAACGVVFAIPKVLHDDLYEKELAVFCPSGHKSSYQEDK